MKRVLQLSYTLALAGTEMVIMNWFRNIDRNKILFDFAITDSSNLYFQPEIEKLGGKVYKLDKMPGFWGGIKFRWGLYKLLKTQGPFDVFHTHSHYSSGFDCLAAWLAGVKKRFVISHFDAGKGPMKNTPFYKKLISRLFIKCFATKRLAVSVEAGKTLYGSNPFVIIKNGIDLKNFFYNKNLRIAKRKELGIENNFVLGNIARFAGEKNHTFLIDVFGEVYKRNKRAVLLLAGKGPLEDRIKAKVKDLGLANAVKFLGSVSDPHALYNAMDCFVFPSLYEGFGIAAIEAQATGLPCIVSDAIPNEACIVNTHKIPLSYSAEKWADIILENIKNFTRRNNIEKIRTAGYTCEETAKLMEMEYVQ